MRSNREYFGPQSNVLQLNHWDLADTRSVFFHFGGVMDDVPVLPFLPWSRFRFVEKYTVSQKKQDTKLLPITLPNIVYQTLCHNFTKHSFKTNVWRNKHYLIH